MTFLISLFSGGVGIYEVHNSGTLYDLGFVLGLGFLVGGILGRARRVTMKSLAPAPPAIKPRGTNHGRRAVHSTNAPNGPVWRLRVGG